MRRWFWSLLLVALFLLAPTSGAFAQQAPLEAGTKVDSVTAKAVTKAAKDWIKVFDTGDPSMVEGLSDNFRSTVLQTMDVQEGFNRFKAFVNSPFHIIKTYDVRQLSDDRYTLQIAYTGGFGTENMYTTQRWVFVQVGDSYLLDGWYPGKAYSPKDWSTQDVSIVLTTGAPTLEDGTLQTTVTANLLTIHFPMDPNQTVMGFFRLHDGIEPSNTLTVSDMDLLELLAADPTGESTAQFAELVPGTYVLVVLDPVDYKTPLQGVNPVAIVVSSVPATPEA